MLHQGRKLVLQVPFLYPLHDEPYDFQRWTIYGLKTLAARHNFIIKSKTIVGHPVETSALLMNIGLSKIVLNWLQKKSPLLFIAPLLILSIPVINISAWILASLCSEENFMPHSYRIVLEKKT